jgi:hypothetical protein
MFEELEEEERGEKEERSKLLRVTAYVVGAILVVGAIVYIASRGHSKTSQPVRSLAAARQTAPDPVMDLHLIHANMGKDPWGTRVMWSVQVRNVSKVYTYRDIQYVAYFLDKDGVRLGEEHNTINDSIGPGEEKEFPEFSGGNYDARGSTYQFLIAGATVVAQ